MEHTSTNSLSSLLELFKVDIHSDMPNGKKINKQKNPTVMYNLMCILNLLIINRFSPFCQVLPKALKPEYEKSVIACIYRCVH